MRTEGGGDLTLPPPIAHFKRKYQVNSAFGLR